MKISCIPLCFWKEIHQEKTMSQEDWIKMAVELGLNGTEMYKPSISSLDASDMARLADVVYDAGLQVSMFTPWDAPQFSPEEDTKMQKCDLCLFCPDYPAA